MRIEAGEVAEIRITIDVTARIRGQHDADVTTAMACAIRQALADTPLPIEVRVGAEQAAAVVDELFPDSPGMLTPKEAAVLRMLDGPLTYREIADELFVSVNTVKTHVASVFRKLDVGNRTNAVRWLRCRVSELQQR